MRASSSYFIEYTTFVQFCSDGNEVKTSIRYSSLYRLRDEMDSIIALFDRLPLGFHVLGVRITGAMAESLLYSLFSGLFAMWQSLRPTSV